MGGYLEAVEPAVAAPARGLGEGTDDAGQVPVLHLLHVVGVHAGARGRRTDGREPLALVPFHLFAHVGELDHQRSTLGMDAVREFPEMGDDGVVGHRELAPIDLGIDRDRGRAAEHGETDAAPRLLEVVELIALPWQVVRAVCGGVAGAHDAVADHEVLEPEGLEQDVIGAHRSLPPGPVRPGDAVAQPSFAAAALRRARSSKNLAIHFWGSPEA